MTHDQLVRRVQRRLRERGLTPYELHQKLRDSVSKQTVYNFVTHGKVVKSDTLVAILAELDLSVAHRRGRTRP